MRVQERRLEILGCLDKFNKEKRENVEVSAEALPSEQLFMLVDVSDYFWWECVKDLQSIELEEDEYCGPVGLDEVAAYYNIYAIPNQEYKKHLAGLEFSSHCMNSSGGSIFEDGEDGEDIEDQFEFDCDTNCKYFCNSEVSKLGLEDNNDLSMYELASLFIMQKGLSEEFIDFIENY